MNFIHKPEWFHLIPIVVFFIGYFLYFIKLKNTSLQLNTKRSRTFLIKFIVRFCVIIAFTTAFLGPYIETQPDKVTIEQKKIVFVLDVSKSMKCLDIEPSRILKAKNIIQYIMDKNHNDLFALVTYASDAITLCPFTKDKNAFQLFLSVADEKLFTYPGSSPSRAWDEVKKLTSSKDTIPTIVVVFTDGQEMEHFNCKNASLGEHNYIYTIGIGSHIGTVVPSNHSMNKDENISKLNKEGLLQFNRCVNGSYFECSDEKNDTKNIVDAIVYFQQKLNHQKQIDRANNMYLYFLWPAFVLMLLDVLFIFKSIKI
jgi:Ca-activated chloride channel family protein